MRSSSLANQEFLTPLIDILALFNRCNLSLITLVLCKSVNLQKKKNKIKQRGENSFSFEKVYAKLQINVKVLAQKTSALFLTLHKHF